MEFLLPLVLYLSLPPAAASLIGTAIMMAIFFAGSLYVIAYALQHQPLLAVAKEEFAALIFSVVIIAFWLSADSMLNPLVCGLLSSSIPNFASSGLTLSCSSTTLGGLAVNHINLAIGSIDIIVQKLVSQYKSLYMFEALIGFLSTVTFPFGAPIFAVGVVSFSAAPFTGLVLLSNAHTVVVEAISYLITVMWAKYFILIFSRDVVPTLLLPLGLGLRAFPITRTTGSSIMALAFAMYFVLPFAVLLSNYLIFDVYKPADFTYTPVVSSYFGTDRSGDETQTDIEESRTEGNEVLEQFHANGAIQEASTQGACSGNAWVHALCSAQNLFSNAATALRDLGHAALRMWSFMVGMSGDFFYTFTNNPMTPGGSSAGLYYFIINEVSMLSPLLILLTVSTVFEIIITVTMYRNISLVIGGEAEIVGLTKVI